jgi:signal transduction histidine kinase
LNSPHCTISTISEGLQPVGLRKAAAKKDPIAGKLLLWACFLLLVCLCRAQPRYSVTYYSTDNGLPANGMKGMIFDSRTGFLWVATEGGLVRFDGKNFSIVQRNGFGKLIDERMIYLVQNRQGEIFAGGASSYIYRINKASVEVYDSISNQPGGVQTIFGLNVSEQLFQLTKTKTRKPDIILLDLVTKVLPVTDTSCMIVHGNRVYYYSPRFDQPEPQPNSRRPAPYPDNVFIADGHFFALDQDRQLMQWDPAASQMRKSSLNFHLGQQDRFCWQNGMEFPILISDTAAFMIRYRQGQLQRELISTGIPRGIDVKTVQYSGDLKTLFLATVSRGLYIVREQLLSYAPRSPLNTSTNESYYTQLVMPDGTILTQQGQQFGRHAYQQPPLIPPTPAKIFNQFGSTYFKDGDSSLYYTQQVETDSGRIIRKLYRYEYATGKRTALRTSKLLLNQLGIQRSGKNIYMAISGDLLRIDKDTLVPLFPSIASSAEPYDNMVEIKPGVLAIATCRYVISYTLATGKTDTLLRLPDNCIRTLFVYKDYLLIGTYGSGIYMSKKGVTKAVPIDRNRHLLYAHCFVPDAEGFCWISSNKGLFKVYLPDLLAAYDNENFFPYYHYFGKADGMVNTEMNGSCDPCAVWLGDSTISFPTMSGLLWVKPGHVKPSLQKREIYLDQLTINDSIVNPASFENGSLPAGISKIVFRLAVPVWRNAENNYIKYRFDGQVEWKWAESDNSITLFNPGSGQHTLEIVRINGFGQGNETRKLIRFTIRSHWYESWLFIAMALVVAISLIYLIVQIRTRQIQAARKRLEKRIAEQTHELKEKNQSLEKKDAIQTRLISIINHDIITPLKFLAATGSKLVEKKDLIDDTVRDETLKEMTRTSKGLQLLAGDILNWIKYHNEGTKLKKESISLHQLIETVFQLLAPVAAQNKVKLVNQVDDSLKAFQYYEPAKVLVYNLVMNAINFSENESVIINGIRKGNLVMIRVIDKGVGMSQEQADNLLMEKSEEALTGTAVNVKGKGFGLGYLIIRDILRLTRIQASIQSQPGAGTVVELQMEVASSQ